MYLYNQYGGLLSVQDSYWSLEIADVFHAEIVGVRETTVTMQFVGREDEVDDFLRLLRPYTIVNLARSGLLAVLKGD